MRSVCVVVVLQTLHLISFSAGQSQKEDGVIDREKFDGRMLRVHNFFRQNVTKGGIKPCAEPMPDLTWDPELASASRKWAERCVMKHDENKGEVGENLAASTTKSTKMIRSWYKEHVNYSFTPIVRRPKKVYGHYTQIVWANTTKLGCYMHYCKNLTNVPPGLRTAYFLVCRYSPPGNFLGQLPYTPTKC